MPPGPSLPGAPPARRCDTWSAMSGAPGARSRAPRAARRSASPAPTRTRMGRSSTKEFLGRARKAFAKLDLNGNGAPSFEEWAVKTIDKFNGCRRGTKGLPDASRISRDRAAAAEAQAGLQLPGEARRGGELPTAAATERIRRARRPSAHRATAAKRRPRAVGVGLLAVGFLGAAGERRHQAEIDVHRLDRSRRRRRR